MAAKEFRKSLAVFPIGTVMTLTGLTARQIRHYEDFGLVVPGRSSTNRRLYSLNDVDRLLEISDLLEEGMTLKGIKRRFESEAERPHMGYPTTSQPLTDQDVRRILWDELDIQGRFR
ncbi:MAG: MerR family transcriptional regulator [Abiotrophia defectiva]|uniref:MerR family transcriptional regulator n=1 Tax=Abiotrophia defectiva TaxID=46125 RepID=UPI0028E31B03|nr:MerR family transcriptional regulator [Abiotrophia defectiva]